MENGATSGPTAVVPELVFRLGPYLSLGPIVIRLWAFARPPKGPTVIVRREDAVPSDRCPLFFRDA
ncbi:hypothetical protein CRG98_047999 [Punica granatum]|uniref:Uncharacterized protein n=1 Tax=Punica granatum TaxID=22663 RepID=A0A2I0HIT1_PUNGR|nr:hypothetical protein CRG98_047999 [Punica granatum]